MGYDLVDVTFSGAATANILTDGQHGAPPQIDAIDGSEAGPPSWGAPSARNWTRR